MTAKRLSYTLCPPLQPQCFHSLIPAHKAPAVMSAQLCQVARLMYFLLAGCWAHGHKLARLLACSTWHLLSLCQLQDTGARWPRREKCNHPSISPLDFQVHCPPLGSSRTHARLFPYLYCQWLGLPQSGLISLFKAAAKALGC